MDKVWILKQTDTSGCADNLAKELNIGSVLANLLVQRGINTYDEARNFFRPNLKNLHDPFLMKDMDKAVNRIDIAIERGEKIMIYGDYDVDGTTAVALVYDFLKDFYDRLEYYIPDRYSEGYGISYKGIDYAAENGFTLIIALDCGIKAVEKIDYALEKGIEFIIADHHRPGDIIPRAVAVLDPKRADCPYPYKELSGCGVGFKLIQAYTIKKGLPLDKLYLFLDMVVVSIASDIVLITGENRLMAYFGLKLLNTNPRPGLEALLLTSGIERIEGNPNRNFNKELTISDLVFIIGPRINAAGRMESGKNSVELLTTPNLNQAMQFAEQINTCNNERRNLDAFTTQQAISTLNNQPEIKTQRTTVVYEPEWHKGVIGIVASRLTEVYYRPTIVFCQANGLITGSARSIKDFDIYDAIDSCSDLLEHFGGHTYAAGLSLKPENLPVFIERFENYAKNYFGNIVPIPEIEIDSELMLTDINQKFFNILKQFAPFGPGNMAPVFHTDMVMDTGYSRLVGKNHIKLSVIHPHVSGFPISGIAFGFGEFAEDICKGTPFSICYHIEENEWNNKVNLQLNVKDIKMGTPRSE
ncbi:MAG: single-stranded-DNA-specific exonuclease RecJ [Bacteroidales bacterium]|nr:single-stranded-DNA-specific exonuclease RecJ [Bacteroidales bacterium]